MQVADVITSDVTQIPWTSVFQGNQDLRFLKKKKTKKFPESSVLKTISSCFSTAKDRQEKHRPVLSFFIPSSLIAVESDEIL